MTEHILFCFFDNIVLFLQGNKILNRKLSVCVFRVGTIEQEIERNTVNKSNFILKRGCEITGIVI